MRTSSIILEISFIINFALIALLLSMVYPRVISWYRKRKKSKQTQENTKIKKVVRDYLKELQK